ncbi:NmrA/HSCARG family protein [Chitinophaga eiseniae]|uniref:NmrA/HSCARG family protein n=1 Tax=Chitinophaga eiseniae TaxID=634771 RepID=A0A847SSM3_9BACT|nr:NmrA/HSCARG family protein [Chitinophaga eiseniae]NLR80586.1 NmrA/HSCARG family protein [Chitinophaga eiseniae]
MNTKPIILVTGATGAQGSSVARALLAQEKFTVRCLTRDITSDKAQVLKELGATLVAGDLADKASLLPAMEDCYAVFGVTSFWEHFEEENQHGKNLVDAVKQSGIRHFIFSTLPSYYELSSGAYSVPHCDGKAALEQYCRSLGIPATFIHMAFYYENFINFFPPQKKEDGNYHFGFPQGNTPLSMVSAEDLGVIIAAILDHPAEYIGRTVGVVGEDKPCDAYAEIMTRVLGQQVCYDHIPYEVFSELGFPGDKELAGMFEVQRLHIPGRRNALIESYRLHPKMQGFEDWLASHKDQIKL